MMLVMMRSCFASPPTQETRTRTRHMQATGQHCSPSAKPGALEPSLPVNGSVVAVVSRKR